jgi:purine-cytosine permease-like protein
MSDANYQSIPHNVRWAVAGFAIIAVLVTGFGYLISRFLGHFLWYVLGAVFVGIAAYLYSLRADAR